MNRIRARSANAPGLTIPAHCPGAVRLSQPERIASGAAWLSNSAARGMGAPRATHAADAAASLFSPFWLETAVLAEFCSQFAASTLLKGQAMQIETDERDPAECVSATVIDHAHTHRDGSVTRFVVYLCRADGEAVPVHVATLARVIELVGEMNPATIRLRVTDGEDRDALLVAFGGDDANEHQQYKYTLH